MPVDNKKKAKLSYKLLSAYKNDRKSWLEDRLKEEEFAYGQQWTTEEAAAMEARGQTTYVVNRIIAYIKNLRSVLTGRVPEAQIVPAGEGNPDVIPLVNQLLKYVLRISYWHSQFKRAVNSMIMKGLGWVWVHNDPYSSEGRGDIKVDYVNVQDVFVPKNSSGIFFDDAESLILSRIISRGDAEQLYPKVRKDQWDRIRFYGTDETEYSKTGQVAEETRQEPVGPQESTGVVDDVEKLENVRIIHRFQREKVRITRIVDTALDETREEEGEVDEESLQPHEVASPFIKTQIRVITSAGSDVYIGEEVLPLENWPLIPFIFEDTENPYPIGAVTIYQGVQKLINKIYSLVLLNIQLASALRYLAEEDSIDLDHWQENASLPGAILTYKRGRQKPEIIPSVGVPASLFGVLQELKNELSHETATWEFQMGRQEGMPATYSQTLAAQEQAIQKINPQVANIDASVGRMYEVILQLVPHVYSEFRLLPIIDEGTEQPQTLALNQPVSPESEILDTLTDVTKFKAYVFVRTGSTVEPSRVAYMSIFAQMAQQNPVFFKYMLEYMDLPNRKQIQTELDENVQLRQMVESQHQQMVELRDFIDSLDRTIVERDRKVELHRFRAELAKVLAKAEADLKVVKGQREQTAQKEG